MASRFLTSIAASRLMGKPGRRNYRFEQEFGYSILPCIGNNQMAIRNDGQSKGLTRTPFALSFCLLF